MRATRHNGSAGPHGAYNPKHNDREFDIKNSDHIDEVMAQQNVYWDCYQGYFIQGQTRKRQFNFSEVERAYYFDKYGDHVDVQNERNEVARHRERNRTVDDVLSNVKTCPEESILQLAHDELVVKISDIDSLIQEVSNVAYDKACEVLTKEISDQVRNGDIDEIEKTKKWLASDERKAPKNLREYAIEQLNGVQNKLRKIADKVLGIVRNTLSDPEKKKAVTDEIAKQARPSVLARLERMKAESEAKASQNPSSKNKNREGRGG